MSRFVVGIDLGTTNCTLAYAVTSGARFESARNDCRPADSAGCRRQRCVRAAFATVVLAICPRRRSSPRAHSTCLGSPRAGRVIGVFAREHGAKVPGRLVSSAKSWLSHSGVDRRAAILPWTAAEDVERISPVAALSAYLEHLRDAWNARIPGKTAADRLENQEVFLTVPASFDAGGARAHHGGGAAAGLKHVTLLEEPQAAFYAWLAAQGQKWRKKVKVGDIILVCDVGGGTTDFTLIAVTDEGGDLALSRWPLASTSCSAATTWTSRWPMPWPRRCPRGWMDSTPASASPWDTPAGPPRRPCSPT